MSGVTGFGWYWIIWAFLGFGIPEAYGLLLNVKDTLSWQFWGIERLNFRQPFDMADWTWLHFTISGVLLFGFLWLFLHLSFGIIR